MYPVSTLTLCLQGTWNSHNLLGLNLSTYLMPQNGMRFCTRYLTLKQRRLAGDSSAGGCWGVCVARASNVSVFASFPNRQLLQERAFAAGWSLRRQQRSHCPMGAATVWFVQ